jgi:signal transduction histidine kinase
MKIRPVSVSTNLLLAMLGTVIIAQLVTGAIFYAQGKQMQLRWSALFWAERVSDVITTLAALNVADRERVLAKLLPDRQLIKSPAVSAGYDAGDIQFVTRFRQRMAALQPNFGIGIVPARMDAPPVDGYLSILADFPAKGDTRLYDVRVGFADGSSSTLRLQQVDRDLPVPASWLIYPLIFLSALILGALIVARGITVPLSRMARAADALGRGLPQPTLQEKGPRELRLAARAFNSMQDRLHRYLDSRTRVLAAMSHDLSTPITRLLLRTEDLSDRMLREKFSKDLQEMREMVQGALDMLKGLGSGESLRPVDVNALLLALQSDYAEMGFDVEVSGSTQRPLVAQPIGLRRLLSNLLDNARKYAGSARMDVSEAGSEVIFRVTDSGPGIPSEKLEQVMEPYFRLDASRNRATGGTGLGLSIARDIAQAHGGRLRLLNVEDSGLQAVVAIPRDGLGDTSTDGAP